jgi:hypothetical protein
MEWRWSGLTDQQPDQIDREQVEVALEILEAFHGRALKWSQSGEALAFYHAAGIVEDALNEEYDPDKEPYRHEWDTDVERSREAREDGYAAATLLGQERTVSVVKADDTNDDVGLLAAFRRIFT